MDGARKAQTERAPTISAAAIFFACLAVSIGATFKVPNESMFDFAALPLPAAVASALAFFCAGMLIFWKPRLGYCLGLAGGLIVAVSIAQSELHLAPGTTWMCLTAGLNAGEVTPFLILRVFAAGLAVTALCCSAMRMLPEGLSVRGRVLRRSTWPAVAVGMAISMVWAVRDATPISSRCADRVYRRRLRVLHVRKSGFHIQQTGIYVLRDQKVYSITTEHQFFHFRVTGEETGGMFPHEPWDGLTRPPAAWTPHSATARSLLWSWNEERWYVRIKDSRLFMFIGPPAHEIAEFLQQLQRMPVDAQSSWTGRDICLGLRYDPLAELGALTPGEKRRSFTCSSAGPAPLLPSHVHCE